MFKKFSQRSLGMQFGLLLMALIAFIVAAGVIVGRSIVVSQVLNEGRSVADMAEHIGSWASQYGGVHVKKPVSSDKAVGSFLERAVYAAQSTDLNLLSGSRIANEAEMHDAVGRTEAYHWKNPALIQREVSDIAAASSSKVRFRITAASVLNRSNAPDAFEQEAIDALGASLGKPSAGHADADMYAATKTARSSEYWVTERNELRYARVIVASKSCLRCHEARDKAPGFLQTNAQFNGGGGFGYEAGKPAGIISVRVPIPDAEAAITSSLTLSGWLALGGILMMSSLIFLFVVRRIIQPVDRLRIYAEKLANSSVGQKFTVPAYTEGDHNSANEVHRLGGAVNELGQSIRILFGKLRNNRSTPS